MINIYSIIVLYNPTKTNLENISVISDISNKTIIIDNSINEVDITFDNLSNIHYIKNYENIGLAKALNIGIKFCLNNDECTHIALFDQDSKPDTLMFDNFIAFLNNAESSIIAVCPKIIDTKYPEKNNLDSIEYVDVPITSGTFYLRSAFDKIGLMDETFFIDYIDYEWCLRAKYKNFNVVRINNAILYHNMGDAFLSFFGIKKPIHDNYLRSYYIIRNQLIFINRHYTPLYYKFTHFIKLFYRIPTYIIFSKKKIKTTKGIILAFIDFFINKKKYTNIVY